MKVSMEDGGTFSAILKEIGQIPQVAEGQAKNTINRCKDVIVKRVRDNLPRSDADGSNYDGSNPYIHMRDDIKGKVKVSKEGTVSLTVMGGKKTAYKWHMVNDGTREPNGAVKTRATHFIDKAVVQSEAEIERLIDDLVAEVADGS